MSISAIDDYWHWYVGIFDIASFTYIEDKIHSNITLPHFFDWFRLTFYFWILSRRLPPLPIAEVSVPSSRLFFSYVRYSRCFATLPARRHIFSGWVFHRLRSRAPPLYLKPLPE
jgi:hypothetical protein